MYKKSASFIFLRKLCPKNLDGSNGNILVYVSCISTEFMRTFIKKAHICISVYLNWWLLGIPIQCNIQYNHYLNCNLLSTHKVIIIANCPWLWHLKFSITYVHNTKSKQQKAVFINTQESVLCRSELRELCYFALSIPP